MRGSRRFVRRPLGESSRGVAGRRHEASLQPDGSREIMPLHIATIADPDPTDPASDVRSWRHASMALPANATFTWYGHSCWELETAGGGTLPFDPLVSNPPNPQAAEPRAP